jgi:hypothetical protein
MKYDLNAKTQRRKDARFGSEINGRILFFDQAAYLPLLHTHCVEERAGERRFPSPSPRWRGATGKTSLGVRTLATNRDAPEISSLINNRSLVTWGGIGKIIFAPLHLRAFALKSSRLFEWIRLKYAFCK